MPRKKQSITSYLDQLTFDPRLLTSPIASYLTNVRIIVLILFLILAAGITSFAQLPRRVNPEINIPIVQVSQALPGATPEDVEKLLAIPLEQEVESVDGVETLTSVSRSSAAFLTVEFSSGTDPDEARREVQSAVDTITDAPDDATDPVVQVFDFEDDPIWQFALTSSLDAASLRNFGQSLSKKLEDHRLVDRALVSGFDRDEIQVLIDPQAAVTYDTNAQSLQGALSRSLQAYPSGSVTSGNVLVPLSLDAQVNNIEDLRQVRVRVGDETIPLGSLATITYAPPASSTGASYIATNKSPPSAAVTFNVYKTLGSDIDEAASAARDIVEQEMSIHKGNFSINTFFDAQAENEEEFSNLAANFTSAIGLVFLVLLIFVGAPQAVIASLTIPLTFLITFAVMNALGLSMNFLSTFSLLLALGMLVDDAIVMIDAVTVYYRTGRFTPREAGLLAWRDFLVPIWTTTITTVWAFLPLLLSSGTIGEFIKSIPLVVSTALVASTSVAVFITLPLMILVVKPSFAYRVRILLGLITFAALAYGLSQFIGMSGYLIAALLVFVLLVALSYRIRARLADRVSTMNFVAQVKRAWSHIAPIMDHGIVDFGAFTKRYRRLMKGILLSKTKRRMVIFYIAVFATFSYALLPFGFVVNEFFPKSDNELFYINIELPQGTRSEVSQVEGLKILEQVRDTSGLAFASLDVGSSFSGGNGGSSSPGPHNILLSILLLPREDRELSSIDIAQNLRAQFETYDKGEIRVVEISGGPPAGSDLQIQLAGDDLLQLEGYADQIVSYLNEQEGIFNTQKSVNGSVSKLVFIPDLDELEQAEISMSQVGFALRAHVAGQKLDEVDFDDEGENTDIVLRASGQELSAESLGQITISTKDAAYPLHALGHFELTPNSSVITRKDGARTMTVSAGVQDGYSIAGLNSELEATADSLNLAPGYSWQTGGVNEENNESVNSIIQAMGLAGLLILGTMVIQLGSYRKAAIVMLVIPLAITGVFVVFAATGIPLSFPALIGLLALFGIVVNNSIVIVDKINTNTRIGMELVDAIVDGAAGRIEPIFLSSLTTIVGLIPISLTNELWRGLGGAIISGLMFSGTMMIFLIPVVYYSWFAPKAAKRKK